MTWDWARKADFRGDLLGVPRNTESKVALVAGSVGIRLVGGENVRFEQIDGVSPWTLSSVTSLLRSELRRIHSGAGRPIASDEAGKIDPELLDRLQSLSYLC